ncbi:pseudouridine synthase [Pleionea sp. CnH1-48]|uniref:pseudouridine synthase n=1 Tax=Pleionea sp. CnH1-48 TaxID=2954494 RepID=UPI0020970330|nr:pseudouridine synthase [Pleionea sp. CnH1-48]MCO7224548.1 pseudouridine synthase [Pleionea sp. CnH1-48]
MTPAIEVIYQDEHIIVVNKPSGLLVHRSEIDKRETRFLIQELREQIGQKVYTVHRLDKPTSGAMVFGLDETSAQHLGKQFDEHLPQKYYLAIVRGFTQPKGLIDYPLKDKAVFRSQDDSTLPTREAITEYETLAQTEIPFAVDRYPQSRYSLLRLKPKTGRRHQLRRHLKHIAHPIIGDTSYGKTTHNQFFRDQFDCHRLLLHAEQLTIQHPVTEDLMIFEAELDDEFNQVRTHLNF